MNNFASTVRFSTRVVIPPPPGYEQPIESNPKVTVVTIETGKPIKPEHMYFSITYYTDVQE